KGGRHPRNGRMPDAPLHVADLPAGVALVPGAIELLCSPPELHDEIVGEVLRLRLTPFLAPKLNKGGLVAAHNDPGVRAADESAALGRSTKYQFHWRHLVLLNIRRLRLANSLRRLIINHPLKIVNGKGIGENFVLSCLDRHKSGLRAPYWGGGSRTYRKPQE